MTVCVGVTVNDCVVFAADSASTLSTIDQNGNSQILNVYRHGDKVFNLFKGLPIAAMTCGIGNLGSASIATLAKRLRQRISDNIQGWEFDPKNYTIQDVAVKARKMFFEECFEALDPKPKDTFEFWVAGYSSDPSAGHEVWKVTISNGNCEPPQQVGVAGAAGLFWGGQIQPISRLVLGYDPLLNGAVVQTGVSPQDADALENHLRNTLQTPFVAEQMPIIDAIELADFLVETTKRYFRFLPGADIVGGETDIAVVTRFEGFKWIRRKHYYPMKLNRLETDHV